MNREWDLPTKSAREAILRRENLVALCKQTDFVNQYLKSRAPAVRAYQRFRELLTGRVPDLNELQDNLVDGMQQRMWINVNGNDGLIEFIFQWSDPTLAYEMVNAAVQGFLEERRISEVGGIVETISILQAHDAQILAEVAHVTKDLEEKQKSLRSNGIVRAAPRIPAATLDPEVSNLRAQLTARRRALADLEDFRRVRLQELQVELNRELPIYAEQHPTIASTRRSIEGLSAPSPQIAALQGEVKSLETELHRRGGQIPEAFQNDAQAQADIAEAQLRLADEDPRLEVERNQLRLLLREHANLQERVHTAQIEADTTKAAFKYRYTVTSPPQFPRGPLQPKPWVVVLGGLLGGMAFALFACTYLDLRTQKLLEVWQIAEALEVPLLGEFKR
jgi:hypothetical protein